ncbi:hypothetical protein ACUWCL_29240, partial [Klebsiella pneumoniae]|uniref:hypothetical protein n=1 Tax=Klebsiella pneumoniae TaxID=573 RepID=UPI0040558295
GNSPVCANFQGHSCANAESNATEEDSFKIYKDLTDVSLFLEQSTQNEQEESDHVEHYDE